MTATSAIKSKAYRPILFSGTSIFFLVTYTFLLPKRTDVSENREGRAILGAGGVAATGGTYFDMRGIEETLRAESTSALIELNLLRSAVAEVVRSGDISVIDGKRPNLAVCIVRLAICFLDAYLENRGASSINFTAARPLLLNLCILAPRSRTTTPNLATGPLLDILCFLLPTNLTSVCFALSLIS